jgi:hypothetical protein
MHANKLIMNFMYLVLVFCNYGTGYDLQIDIAMCFTILTFDELRVMICFVWR